MRARVSLNFVGVGPSPSSVLPGVVLISLMVLQALSIAPAQTVSQESSAVSIRVPDAELIDQNGHAVHLYSDLVKGRRVVVINTMFTTCGTICPLIGVRMSQLQKSLGACQKKDYMLISISVDPTVDTAERLREWGSKFNAGPCWRLLTGLKPDVDAALRTLHLLPPDKLSHTPSALIGRDGGDDWTLFNVLASQDNLLRIVRTKMSASVARKGSKE